MPKETKTASELREMVLAEILLDPMCPEGMGVAIWPRGNEGDWVADGIPPRNQPISYANVQIRIARIGMRLRETYDLVGGGRPNDLEAWQDFDRPR